MTIDQEIIRKNKEKLLTEKERIERLLKRVADPNEVVAGDYQAKYEDYGDKQDENATEVAQYEANIAEEKSLEKKLDLVVRALERIEKGNYGKCIIGGEDISPERLEAAPEAEHCIDHADQSNS